MYNFSRPHEEKYRIGLFTVSSRLCPVTFFLKLKMRNTKAHNNGMIEFFC